ncbi:MAG: sensor histidine kinase [Bacteroidota bacterium]|jgi:signal transduction histidine kinase
MPSQTDIYILLFGGTLLMFLLAGMLLFFVTTYQKRLLRNKADVEQMKSRHQLDLFQSSIDAMEDERRRVSRDLHDEIGAALSMLRLQVGQLNFTKENQAENTEKLIVGSKHLIDSTIENVRRISNDMLPHGLEEFGLIYALEMLCDKIESASSLVINLDLETLERLENRLELALYRILQELLNNTIKHAQATEINISLSTKNQKTTIIYQDNGKGFDIDSLAKRGLGLKNIESRVSMIHGTLTYIPTVEKGVDVRITLST